MHLSSTISSSHPPLFLTPPQSFSTLNSQSPHFFLSTPIECTIYPTLHLTLMLIAVILRCRSIFCTQLPAYLILIIRPCSCLLTPRKGSCTTPSHSSPLCFLSSIHLVTSLTKKPCLQIFYRQKFLFQSLWPVSLCSKGQGCSTFMSFRVTNFLSAPLLFASFRLTILQFPHSFSRDLFVLMSFPRSWFSTFRFHLFYWLMKDYPYSFGMPSFFGLPLSVIEFSSSRSLFSRFASFLPWLLPILWETLHTPLFHLFFCQ